jgi:hypothetical protein
LTRKSLQYCLKNTDETIVVKSLMQCFDWEKTREGVRYWYNIYRGQPKI